MIQRVYEQCKKAKSLNNVIVVTDDQRIYDEVEKFGGHVQMTYENHLNGTSRCAEYIENYNTHPKIDYRYNYAVNIQGDEPFIHPNQIDELTALFKDKNVSIATQVKKETDLSLLNHPNIVKAILDENNYVLDFKRIIDDEKSLELINKTGSFYKHIGIYGFKTNLLLKLVKYAATKNETENHLEQLRWLDNGYTIKAAITEYESISIDTKEDLEKARKSLHL